MSIQDIIESIAKIEKTVAIHMTKETYSLLPGNLPSVVDEQSQTIWGKDDSIAALFDADLFGWDVRSISWLTVPDGAAWLELDITLFKTKA